MDQSSNHFNSPDPPDEIEQQSLVDTAAVEAAEKVLMHIKGCMLNDDGDTSARFLARIITDAYAAKSNKPIAKCFHHLEDMLTTEQAMRKELVKALRQYPCCCSYTPTPSHLPRKLKQCSRCAALAAAEKLEKE